MLQRLKAIGDSATSRPWAGYVLAVAATTLAVLLRWALPGALTGTPYLAFYPAVVAAAAFGGMGPGLLATVATVLCVDLLFDTTPGWVDLRDPVVLGRTAIFLAGGIGISLVAGLRQAAQNKMRRQAAALEAAANGIALTDASGTILWANHAFGMMTGYSVEEVLGRNPRILKSGRQDATFYRNLWETIGRGEVWHGELINRRKDGTLYTEEMTITPVPGEHGRHSHYIAIKQDVTARKESEQQLKELNETLERRVAKRTAEAERRAEQLRRLAAELTQTEQRERRRLAQVLHDHLQQLLVAARFNTSIARSVLHDGQADQALREVDGLLNQSIDATRSLTAELSPVILYNASFADALRWLGGWMRDKHGLTVHVEADPAVDPREEDIRVLLFQAVRELLFNVVKHAGVNHAAVQLDRPADNQVRVTVADEGAGFDPARAGQSNLGGSGLGLFSVHERLELLGGCLAVHSAPGRGTRMVLVVPVAPTVGVADRSGPPPRE